MLSLWIYFPLLSMSTSSFESLNFDEFSLENPINRSSGRRSRLLYLSHDSSNFAEGKTVFYRLVIS